MSRVALLTLSALVILAVPVWLPVNALTVRSSETMKQSAPFARCFQDAELSENIGTLKLQGGSDTAKASDFLLSRAKAAPGCRAQVVHALIAGLERASQQTTNKNESYFFWENGASLLADLNAIEALDLLIANIDLTDGWSASISAAHFPALVAVVRIGTPAIPKLQMVLHADSNAIRRKFAAFCLGYIGGVQARKSLSTAVPDETDPCVKKFLRVSLRAFDNKAKPNHISSALSGKWLSAFYCL